MTFINTQKVKAARIVVSAMSPICAALPWLLVLTTPVVEELVINNDTNFLFFVVIVLAYAIYFVSRGIWRELFRVAVMASFASLIATFAIYLFARDDCAGHCIGLLNRYAGLSCEYIGDGCLIENVVLFYASSFAFGVWFLISKRHARKGQRCNAR